MELYNFENWVLYHIAEGTVLDERTDVWSLGTLLYFMAYQAFAFDPAQGSVHLGSLSSPLHFLCYGLELMILED